MNKMTAEAIFLSTCQQWSQEIPIIAADFFFFHKGCPDVATENLGVANQKPKVVTEWNSYYAFGVESCLLIYFGYLIYI